MKYPTMPRSLLAILFLLAWPVQAALLTEQPLRLQSADGVLHGTLLLPGGSRPTPVALLVAGSGPTDRNGNQPQARNDSLKRLARLLASHGIASLRFDKRGVAASQAAEPDERLLSVERYAADLVAWSRQLRQDERLGPLILIGHSEGALIASLAANDAQAAALVLIAGSGRPIDELLLEQLRERMPTLPRLYSEQLIRQLKAGHSDIPVPDALHALFRPSVQPYLVSLFRQDPRTALAATRLPTLIIQGDHDIQVAVEDARELASARPDARLALIPGMNHVLRETAADAEDPLASYDDPSRPLHPQLGNALFPFLEDAGMLPPSSPAQSGR